MPSSTITPEKSTQTGVGATAWASASQKWNGTIAPLTASPETIRTNDATTRPSAGRPASSRPICAKLRRAGPAVDQGDPHQDEEGTHAVDHREVQGAFERFLFLDLVARQRVRGHTHQLEEDEHVEQVTGQAEADHAGQEHEHQGVIDRPDRLEVAPRVDERGRREGCREAGQARAERIDDERDAQRNAVARLPVAGPGDDRSGSGAASEHDAEDRAR